MDRWFSSQKPSDSNLKRAISSLGALPCTGAHTSMHTHVAMLQSITHFIGTQIQLVFIYHEYHAEQ